MVQTMASMYRKFLLLFLLLGAPLLAFRKVGEEREVIAQLIAQTERQLAHQQKLSALMEQFEADQDLLLEEKTPSKECALRLVTTAREILTLIQDNHYEEMFPPFFLQELKMFATHAWKRHGA
jgi:hypothetical protein